MTKMLSFLVVSVRLGLPVPSARVPPTWYGNSTAAKNLRTRHVFLAPPIAGTAIPPKDISAVPLAFRLAFEI